MTKKQTCPCCGYKTSETEYDICPICFWENDFVQLNDPDFSGGANDVSLRQAQKNFRKFGAKERMKIKYVRKPTPKDVKNPNFKPLKSN